MKFWECDSINSKEDIQAGCRLQKWFMNCNLIMCLQNSSKLWCQYKFISHSHSRNSDIAPQWYSTENTQEGYRNGLSKTRNSTTVNNNYLCQPCTYQHACELKLPGPCLITQSQLGCFLQNVMNINFWDWFLSFQH